MSASASRFAGSLCAKTGLLILLHGFVFPAWAGDLSLGINVNRVVDYNPSWVFVDAMKSSRPWIPIAYNTVTKQETWNDGEALELNAFGMPAALKRWKNEDGQLIQQRIATLVFREIGDAFPAGPYRAEWKGTGRVEFSLSATPREQSILDDGTHVAELDVIPSDAGIMIKILDVDPQDPIRALRLWMPPYQEEVFSSATKSPFHPLFKQRLEPFSTIRFVDWTATNWTTPHTWSERTRVDTISQSAHQNGKGVALEYIVALANELQKDCWINTPPWADDEYVREMAEFFRDNLEPGQKIYVEWANELWNFAPGFATHVWLKEELKRPESKNRSLWEVAAENIQRDLAIWTDVFANSPERVVRVVAGQSANPWVAKELVKNVGIQYVDAIACSAYIQLTPEQRSGFGPQTNVDDILATANQNLPRVRAELAAHKRLSDMCSKIAKRPVRLLGYEGGQHFDAGGREVTYLQALYDVQVHPGIEDIYRKLFAIVEAEGVELLNHYAYVGRNTPYGSWGALSRQDQSLRTAPKYRALLDRVER